MNFQEVGDSRARKNALCISMSHCETDKGLITSRYFWICQTILFDRFGWRSVADKDDKIFTFVRVSLLERKNQNPQHLKTQYTVNLNNSKEFLLQRPNQTKSFDAAGKSGMSATKCA
jgi:hypothetical protein